MGFSGGIKTCNESCEWDLTYCCMGGPSLWAACASQGKVLSTTGNGCGTCVSCPEYIQQSPTQSQNYYNRVVNLRSFDGQTCVASCKMLDGTWKSWEDTGYQQGQYIPELNALIGNPNKTDGGEPCNILITQCPYPRRDGNGHLLPTTCAFGVESKPDEPVYCVAPRYSVMTEYCTWANGALTPPCTLDYVCAPEVTDEDMVDGVH
jgi:hypothetical protein